MGEMNGQGTMTQRNGRKYVGEWKNNKYIDGNSTIAVSPKITYEGLKTNCYSKNEKVETFKEQTKDGVYEGQMTCKGGDGCNDGELSGTRVGEGTMHFNDGRVYVGQWKDSKMHGKGTATQLNGRRYLGQWKDNKRHGKGIILYKKRKNKYCNGQVTYSSNWKDDKMYGQGEMTYTDGRKERFWATANGLGPNLLKPVNFPPKPPARKNETVTPTAKPKPDGPRHCTRYPEPSAPPMDGPRHCTRDPKPSAPPMDGPHHCTESWNF